MVYILHNLYFMAKFRRLKMLKRFRFGEDSITNLNSNMIRLAIIMNPNLNIRDLEEKIRIRIRIFVTTLLCSPPQHCSCCCVIYLIDEKCTDE